MWKNGPHLIGGWKFQTVHFFYWIWCQNYVPCFIHAIWISKLEWPNRRAPLWCVTNLQCPVGCQEDWNSLWGGQMSPKCKSELNMFYTWVIQIRNDCNTTDEKSFLKLMDNVIGHSLKQQNSYIWDVNYIYCTKETEEKPLFCNNLSPLKKDDIYWTVLSFTGQLIMFTMWDMLSWKDLSSQSGLLCGLLLCLPGV